MGAFSTTQNLVAFKCHGTFGVDEEDAVLLCLGKILRGTSWQFGNFFN